MMASLNDVWEDTPDFLPNVQSVYAPADTNGFLGVEIGQPPPFQLPERRIGTIPNIPHYPRGNPSFQQLQTTGLSSPSGVLMNAWNGIDDAIPGSPFDEYFDNPSGAYPEDVISGAEPPFHNINSLRYEDGVLPSFGGEKQNSLYDPLRPHEFKPNKSTVLQSVMRAPPQPENNVFGDPSNYRELHERINSETKFTRGNGAFDGYNNYSGGQQEGFASGQYITERTGGLHPRTRYYPQTEYKKGLQMYGRMGNPTEATGMSPGSTWSEGTGPLGAFRENKNAAVYEYEREPMPTSADGEGHRGARFDEIYLRRRRDDGVAKREYVGPMHHPDYDKESLRLLNYNIRGKNSISREEVGFVGTDNLDRGSYQNSRVHLAQTKRNANSVDSRRVAQPYFRKEGAYQNVGVRLDQTNRNLISVDSRKVTAPHFKKDGAYQNVNVDLDQTLRNLVSTDSRGVQAPHFRKDAAYQNVNVDLNQTLRNLVSTDSRGVQAPHFRKDGAYQNVNVDLNQTLRNLVSTDSRTVQAPHFRKDGAYENVNVNLNQTLRNLVSTDSRGVQAPHFRKDGAYQNVNMNLDQTLRNLVSTDSRGVQAPHFRKDGAYQNVNVDLNQTLRNLVSTDSRGVQAPHFRKDGAYENVNVNLNQTLRNLMSTDSRGVQAPHFRKDGAYDNVQIDLDMTKRGLISNKDSRDVQAPYFRKDGAYDNVQIDLDATKRSLISNRDSRDVQAPHFRKDGAYDNVRIDLDVTKRSLISNKDSRNIQAPYFGKDAAYENVNIDLYGTNRQTTSRPMDGFPVINHDSVSDWRMNERINDACPRPTKKSEHVEFSSIRPPISHHDGDGTGAIQYILDFPNPVTRRVTKTMTQHIDPSLINAYKSNPYTIPITNS
jgi:hypothetical protein